MGKTIMYERICLQKKRSAESRGAANQRIGVIFDGIGSDFGTRLLQGIGSEWDSRQSHFWRKLQPERNRARIL